MGSKSTMMFIVLVVAIVIASFAFKNEMDKKEKIVDDNEPKIVKKNELPKPELSEGLRGEYGIDKNINEKTIDNYLNREDTVYIDLRMLEDTASWENKGGSKYITGYIKGFEVIPYPYLATKNKRKS